LALSVSAARAEAMVPAAWNPSSEASRATAPPVGAATGAATTNAAAIKFDDSAAQLTLTPQYLADLAPADRRPLMRLLDRWGLAEPLDNWGIDIYGFIQVSYTYNFTDPNTDDPFSATPARHRILGRMFDHHHGRLALNRLDLFVQRAIDYRSGEFDVGFMLETQYGIDAAMMHSNGLFDYDWPDFTNHAKPENQYDLTQLYVDVGVPLGTGLRVRGGKFATLIGYESCDPTTRTTIQFYSRTWILTMGIPMYQTGVIGTYDITDNVTINGGITRGWDQAIDDNNNAIDFLGSVNWRVNDNLTLYGATSIGPQQPDDDDNYRTLLNGTIYYTPDLQGPWVFAADGIVGWEDNQITSFLTQGETPIDDVPVGDTYWFGIAAFAAYKINPNLVAKGRVEWFHDDDGTRWRVPTENQSFVSGPMNNPYVEIGDTIDSVSFTLGLDIIPFPNDAKELLVRPEIRVDLANEDIFHSGEESTQITGAIDIIYKF
jgi:hypothetical protein